MIHVLAFITTKPGMRDEVLSLFDAVVPLVQSEDGCIEYGATVDHNVPIQTPVGPDTFVVVEKWESLDHLSAHGVAPHMAAFGAKTKGMLTGRTVHVLQPA